MLVKTAYSALAAKSCYISDLNEYSRLRRYSLNIHKKFKLQVMLCGERDTNHDLFSFCHGFIRIYSVAVIIWLDIVWENSKPLGKPPGGNPLRQKTHIKLSICNLLKPFAIAVETRLDTKLSTHSP